MQETGWTNHSLFLVLYGLKKGFTLDTNKHFPVYWAFFGIVTNDQTNKVKFQVSAATLQKLRPFLNLIQINIYYV